MITILDDMRAFGTGFHTNRPEKREMDLHLDWYQGRYTQLYPSPMSLASGRLLLSDDDLIPLRLFKEASDFMDNAVIGDMPAVSPNTPAQERWVEENMSMIDRALRRGTRHWGIHDIAVYTASSEGEIEAVDPRYYYRVGKPDQKDELVGHIIAYPYREPVLSEINVGTLGLVPNRILVKKVYPEGTTQPNGDPMPNTEQLFAYQGAILGRELSPVMTSSITAVCVAGKGESWYQGVKELAARIILEFSNQHQMINRNRNKIDFKPSSVVAAMRNALSRQDQATAGDLRGVRRNLDTQRFPTAGLDMGQEKYLDPQPMGVNTPFERDWLETALNLFYMASGIPPTAFGVGIGKGESGYAREKAQTAASSRAAAYRRDLVEKLPILSKMAGAPPMGGMIGFNWSAPPFADKTAEQAEIIALYNAGLITIDEARSSLGWKGTMADAMAATGLDRTNGMSDNQNQNENQESEE